MPIEAVCPRCYTTLAAYRPQDRSECSCGNYVEEGPMRHGGPDKADMLPEAWDYTHSDGTRWQAVEMPDDLLKRVVRWGSPNPPLKQEAARRGL